MSLDARTHESPPIRGVDDLVSWFRGKERPRERLEGRASSTRRCCCAPARSARCPYEGRGGRRRGAARPSAGSGTSRSRRTGGSSPRRRAASPSRSSRAGSSSCRGGPSRTSTSSPPSWTGTSRSAARSRDGARASSSSPLGYRPWGVAADGPWMPKKRYAVMRPFLAARGRLAEDMMAMTASVQACFDFSGERDIAREAPRRARDPAGGDGAARELADRRRAAVGVEELPGRGLGRDRPGALRAPRLRVRARVRRRRRTAATSSGRSTCR